MIERIEHGVQEIAQSATLLVARTGPIVGAALLGLDELGAEAAAGERARRALDAAFVSLERGDAYPADGHTVVVGPRAEPASSSVHA
jgi:hypothetical protein